MTTPTGITTSDLHFFMIQLNSLAHHIRALENSNTSLRIENATLKATVRASGEGSRGNKHNNKSMSELNNCLESSLKEEEETRAMLIDAVSHQSSVDPTLAVLEYCSTLEDKIVASSSLRNQALRARKNDSHTIRKMREGMRDARGEIKMLRERVEEAEGKAEEERRMRGEEKKIRQEFERELSQLRKSQTSTIMRLQNSNKSLQTSLNNLRSKFDRRERVVSATVVKWREATEKLVSRIHYLEGLQSDLPLNI